MKLHSAETLQVHKNILEGYKKRLGEIESFSEEEEELNTSFERSFLHNAIYLHTLWFEQFETTKEDTKAPLLEEILQRRDSDMNAFQKWLSGFAQDAKPHGWAIWGWSHSVKTFVGFPISSHDEYVPLGVVPLLVIDCWEHSYINDYSTDFTAYLEDFWKMVNWEKIDERHHELAAMFGFDIK